tara:strand:- start:243 stop:896 length:654 start_codon:yes stop_codon:yes gene_type:complete
MILNVYKPKGWSSFDVVKKIRYIVKEKKVGHGGTLDPFAEGVLIIGTGADTKRLTKITSEDKSYHATLLLGKTTDTLDTEGEVIKEKPIPELDADTISKVLDTFSGITNQTPPMYSAKKVNGTRLYKLARKNITVKREPVQINIKTITLEEFTENTISFSLTCSKGTYIRVLGYDIALKLGTVGYLTGLIRTQIGHYRIDDSQSIKELEDSWKSSII